MSPKTVVWTLACVLVVAAPAAADSKVERRLALEPGGTFTLDTVVGAVTLTGDASSGAVVSVTSRRDDLDKRFDFQFVERAGGVTVMVRHRGGWLSGIFGGDWFFGDVHFLVSVPRKTIVDIKTSGGRVEISKLASRARVHSSGGGLRVEDVEGEVEARTSGGSIQARRLGGSVLADTSGGSIEIANVQGGVRAETSGGGIQIDTVAGEVYADTSGGGVRVRSAGGRVEAHSSGGPVIVGFAAGNNRGGALSSSGGGVRVELDPEVALSIDADSSGGDVNSDLPVTTRGRISSGSLRGDLNGGGQLLRLRSSGGGVRISRATNR